KRRPQSVANRDCHHGGEEYQIDILDPEQRPNQSGRTDPKGNNQERHHIWHRIEWLVTFRRAYGLLWNRVGGKLLAGNHIDADIAGAADQIMAHRAARELEPKASRRFTDDDLGHIIGLREADDVVGDAASDRWNGERLAAECLGQP